MAQRIDVSWLWKQDLTAYPEEAPRRVAGDAASLYSSRPAAAGLAGAATAYLERPDRPG
jgi:hypothetical protein